MSFRPFVTFLEEILMLRRVPFEVLAGVAGWVFNSERTDTR